MRVHRWMGVAFCVLFPMWFLSGFVMMYRGFPYVDPEDRLRRAVELDAARILVTPERALAAAGVSASPSQIRLNSLDGRPVYRFAFGRRLVLVFADDGQRIDAIPQEMALRIASAWTGFSPRTASPQGLRVQDYPWTFYSTVRPYGPFYKFSFPNREEVYVSQSTGEVVQDTTPASRIGAYFGAIPHWLYFAWLQSNPSLWAQAVIWLAGAGAVMSFLGLVAGVWLYSPSQRYRFRGARSSIPFAGLKHWHVVLGLIFGIVTCSWVFSGLLSMGPFSFLNDRGLPDLERALRQDRIDIAKFAAKSPREAIAEAHGLKVKELEFALLDKAPFYLAKHASRESRIVPVSGDSQDAFKTEQIIGAVKQAAAPTGIAATRLVTAYEPYYVDRENRMPLPAVYVQLNDAGRSSYYIDPRTGMVVQSYGTRSRWNRWLYHGLHSIDLPWLYSHRPAWDIVVILLLLGGTSLSITSLSIAWSLLRRKFA
ncbi:MAG: PepSY domain-containing protein [Bryobacteraceae bacterium]|jgi:hypothetical protein